MANRFDKPIESEYISLYTPIPFELLYAIGKANNERVDKAYLDLGNLFTKWAEFRSPSAVDTKRWYDLTINAGQDIVNQLAANPDLIKTQEGRSLIQSFINSRPYLELGLLLQSREGLLLRQKINQLLMLAGKYNPLWHDVDFTNYNTSGSGVYNDLSPLAYKSEVDLVKPYVDNLKSAFIKNEGLYNYSGVSADRTDAELNKNMSAIFNTPEAQKHIETLQKTQGLTKEAAEQLFANTLYTAGREFTYENREADPYALLRYKAAAAGISPLDYNSIMLTPREKLSSTITTGVLKNMDKIHSGSKWAEANIKMIKDITTQYVQAVKDEDEDKAKQLTELHSKISEAIEYNKRQMIRNDFRSMYGGTINLAKLNLDNIESSKFNKVSTDLIDKYSTAIPAKTSERFLDIQYGSPVEIKTSNGNKSGYYVGNSNRVLLPQYLAAAMMGTENPENAPGVAPKALQFAGGYTKDEFVRLWRDGAIKNVLVVPLDRATIAETNDGRREYVKVKVIVPMQSLEDIGMDTAWIPVDSRNRRVSRDLNATVDKDNDSYEFVGYVPLNEDYQTAEEYNRASTNEWVGHTVGDADRYNEFKVESERLYQHD